MRLAHLTMVILAAAVVVACGPAGPPASPAGAGDTPTPGIALRTQEPQPAGTGQACPAALIEAMLVHDESSGLALRDQGGAVHQVIWPHGYSARTDGARLVLLDAAGNVVAHEGDRVAVGGGEIDANGTWLACGGTTVVAP